MSKIYKISLISLFLFTVSVQLYMLDEVSQLSRSVPQVSEQLADFSESETANGDMPPALVFRLSETDKAFISDTIKTVVKSELENMPKQTVMAASHTKNNIPVPVTQQSIASYERSNAILEQAINKGDWTQEDFSQIIPHMNELTPEQRDQLSLRFVESLNSGQIDIKNMNRGIIPF